MSEINEKSRGVLVGVCESSRLYEEAMRSLDELERLFDTAGGECVGKVVQAKPTLDARTIIGSGKAKEIAELCKNENAEIVVFDFELSPSQIRNLEEEIEDCKVIDRSMLILDIFALHAVTGEGKLQVELAQLKYSAPRLIGKGLALSRQGGGIGSRGPGESKLETDRRHLHERIHTLETALREMEHNRTVMRQARDRSGLMKIAIVGYTNAGKSTLLNRLTDAGVLTEDKLFATLDPTTRRLELPCGESVLLTDTVGFIRKLPHHLVEAFKSTLEEVTNADIILIVIDSTDPECLEQLKVTEELIEQLGASDKPRLYVYNKAENNEHLTLGSHDDRSVAISARLGEGIDGLLALIEGTVASFKRECKLLIPYANAALLDRLYKEYSVLSSEYRDDGVYLCCRLDTKGIGVFGKYIFEGAEDAEL